LLLKIEEGEPVAHGRLTVSDYSIEDGDPRDEAAPRKGPAPLRRSRAGVPRARIYDLRHFAATQMVSAGVNLVDVAAILGHTRPSTTSDIYSHYLKGRGKAAVAEIAKVLARK
jgi:integrase